MSPPTIDERCDAQERVFRSVSSFLIPHLLTADELRAVLVELEHLRIERNEYPDLLAASMVETNEQARLLGASAERECDLRGKLERAERHAERVNDANDRLVLERDQWRDLATAYRHSRAFLRDIDARFDALVKEEKQ